MKTSPNRRASGLSLAEPKLLILPGIVLLLIVSLILIPAATAQGVVNELAALDVELWPDFDRPAVLVLLTGTLADDAPSPATVVLPMPDDASINAVAHVNVQSGELENIADVDSSTPGQISFTTPSPTFRIEYYMPYALEGDQREFTFDWQSDIAIEQLAATVQQPAEASGFELSPASDQAAAGRDGLIYHPLDVRALPAGQSFSLTASYELAGDQLSADLLSAQQPAVEGPLPLVSDPVQGDSSEFNWPLVAIVAGGLIMVAAVAWFLYANSQSSRKRTPRPRPSRRTNPSKSRASTPSSGAQFCHNCGQAVDGEDRFCRECGTALKGR